MLASSISVLATSMLSVYFKATDSARKIMHSVGSSISTGVPSPCCRVIIRLLTAVVCTLQ